MPRLRRTRPQQDTNTSLPVDTGDLPGPPTILPTEQVVDAPQTAASNLPPVAALPRITLQLPAIGPDDLDADTLHIRDTMSRLPAVRKQDLARHLPRTTLNLPALRPATSVREVEDEPLPAQRAVIFIPGAPPSPVTRIARWKTPTRVRLLFRLALLPLAFLLLVGTQNFAARIARDCQYPLGNQPPQTCLVLSLLSPFANVLPYSVPQRPTALGKAPVHTGPKLPTVPTDLPMRIYAFIKLALPYAFQAHEDLGWQTSVILAQWGLEEGWYVPSATGYNWGNVRSVPGAPTVSGSHLTGSFAYAATPADGLRYYLYAARLSYYTAVTAAARYGANATAEALGRSPWDGGHYTNIGQPGSSLLAIMRTYNLYRLD